MRSKVLAVLVSAVPLVGAAAIAPAAASHMSVTSVTGSAYGYRAYDISLFGGAQAPKGPTPTVQLAPDASDSPRTGSAPSGIVQYGPATLFTSDAITVRTEGSLGTAGSVTSTSGIANINKSTTQPAVTGSEIFTADNLSGTATASESGASGSTTVTGGFVDVHSNSFNCTSLATPCGGHTHPTDNPLTPLNESLGQVAVPTNPPVNYVVQGHVHLCDSGPGCIDYYVIAFNEQITNPDGSITVNPAHEYFGHELVANPNGAYVDASGNRYHIAELPPYSAGGPVLHGHLVLGQVVAGVTTEAAPPPSAPPAADFDGDGDSDISVFRPANGVWFVQGGPTVGWGANGDLPVPADYDGDGDAEIGVFRPSNGVWYVQGGPTVGWGANGDRPVPADYDGDGDADVAVFRPSNGVWFVQGGATTAWGTTGDRPLPLPVAIANSVA